MASARRISPVTRGHRSRHEGNMSSSRVRGRVSQHFDESRKEQTANSNRQAEQNVSSRRPVQRSRKEEDKSRRQVPTRKSPGMTMAERTKLHLEAKERKLEKIKREMMHECTFTPETNHSGGSRSVHSSKSSPTAVRITPPMKKKSPESANQSVPKTPSGTRVSPKSLSSAGTSADMNRINELYMDGVLKNRAFTDKVCVFSVGFCVCCTIFGTHSHVYFS